jgi:hypothetical protein
MSQTHYACGCVVVDGIRTVDCGTHTTPDNPEPLAITTKTTPAETPHAVTPDGTVAPDPHRHADGTYDFTHSIPAGETRGPAVPAVEPPQESEAERQRVAHTATEPEWYADETPGAKVRRLEAEAELAAGKEPKDTRTAAEKKADKDAADVLAADEKKKKK